MSQDAVERLLGRLVTDEQFRRRAMVSLESACIQEGYRLTAEEQQLVSGLDLRHLADIAARLDPGLCRVGQDG